MRRLLLVDDDPDVLDALCAVLSGSFEVVGATDGAEALRWLQLEPFDVVLLDLMMPVLDGEGVVAAMQAAGLRVPVLLGSASPDLPQLAGRIGLPYIMKPYSIQRLLAGLNQLAGGLPATPGG